MQILETELKAQNRTLKQLKREGRVAIYELLSRGNLLYGYEVIIVKILPARNIMGRDYPEREGYPANEDWGDLAWSYPNTAFQSAAKRFEGLVKDEQAGRLPGTPAENKISLVSETQNVPA
jgi:hypothetical protein